MPDLFTRMLAKHVSDSVGYCLGCTMRGSQNPITWPCSPYGLANTARKIRDEQYGH